MKAKVAVESKDDLKTFRINKIYLKKYYLCTSYESLRKKHIIITNVISSSVIYNVI